MDPMRGSHRCDAMIERARILMDSFAAGAFAISAVLTALRTTTLSPDLHTEQAFMSRDLADMSNAHNLLGVVAQPTNPVLWALLAAVLVATGLYLAARAGRAARGSVPHGLQTLGLICAAAWPWILNPSPLAGLVLAAVSCLLLAAGIMRRDPGAPRGGWLEDLAMPFVAGWLLMAATSSLGMYVHEYLGVGLERATLIGLLPAALLGAWGQLRMDGAITFSLAIIWAMIGFAAATAGSSITIATACVMGISALAVVLVRVTT